jgi:hypothetical protein
MFIVKCRYSRFHSELMSSNLPVQHLQLWRISEVSWGIAYYSGATNVYWTRGANLSSLNYNEPYVTGLADRTGSGRRALSLLKVALQRVSSSSFRNAVEIRRRIGQETKVYFSLLPIMRSRAVRYQRYSSKTGVGNVQAKVGLSPKSQNQHCMHLKGEHWEE